MNARYKRELAPSRPSSGKSTVCPCAQHGASANALIRDCGFVDAEHVRAVAERNGKFVKG